MITDITSHSNPQYKFLKSLSRARNRKEQGAFLLEGHPELEIGLRAGLRVLKVIWSPFYVDAVDIDPGLQTPNVEFIRLSRALFDGLAYQQVPGNYMLLVEKPITPGPDRDVSGPIVVLENVEKPGNLGGVLRTCDAAGIKWVIVSNSGVDLFNPNTIRNSRGAVFTVGCQFLNNAETLDFLRSNGFWIIAVDPAAGSTDFRAVTNANQRKAFVFGSESTGLSRFWKEKADERIHIPMRGVTDSLNLSVSVGVVVYANT